ncbi:MAG: SPOR domain-containing protein [Betaproteobacteria bacterium]
MRALALLLILANLGLFAWAQYAGNGDAEPVSLGRGLDSERLKVVRAADLPPPKAAKAAARCLEWGSFTPADASRAEKALEPLALGPRLAPRRGEETAGWWVFIASQGSRAAAQKKAAELKGLGVDDYFIVEAEGVHRFALSLGVFRSEEAAQARLAGLRERGVRSAQVGERETQVQKVWFQVKSAEPALEARLREIAREIEGSELRSCS